MTLLLRNANSLVWDLERGDFLLRTGHLLLTDRLTHIPADQTPPDAAREVDLGFRLVTPPLVNCHHHFYSLPARGLVPRETTADFSSILEKLWWKLDSALTPDVIRLAARQSLQESIHQGVLTVFDHHSSPGVTDRALQSIAGEFEQLQMRGVLCHEVSDRNGNEVRDAQLAENRVMIAAGETSQLFRGVAGLHASFTLADETLAQVAGAPVHIHLAEDPVDNEQSLAQYGQSACRRLSSFNLLQPGSILAHGNHLSDEELQLVADSGSCLVHNPHSNMNNAAGTLNLSRAIAQGCMIAPGTDGMHSSITATLKQAFLLARHNQGDPTVGFAEVQALVQGMYRLGRHYFPRLPLLNEGDISDLVVWDYKPLTRLSQDNLWGHIIYGLLERRPLHVIRKAEFLVEEGVPQVETVEVCQAQELMNAVWEEFYRA